MKNMNQNRIRLQKESQKDRGSYDKVMKLY